MSNPLPSPVYLDSPGTAAFMAGAPVFSSPFAGVSTQYVLRQKWQQRADNFSELALNTPHPDFATFILAEESERDDVGGGYVRWTRTYAKVPATRNEYASINYNFIGYVGLTVSAIGTTVAPSSILGRPRSVASVTCRIQYDYLLTTNPQSDFTTNFGQRYYIPAGVWDTATIPVFHPQYPDPVQSALHGLPVDLIFDTTGPFAFAFAVPSVPSRTDYETLRANKSEIIVEDSQVSRWMGNIFQRITKYVIAQ